MVKGAIDSYMSEQDIMDKFDFESLKQTAFICKPYYEDRAKRLIAKLSPLDKEIPLVIRIAIWKLSILGFTAKRLKNLDMYTNTVAEKIENLTIKAKFLDSKTWQGIEFDIVDEEVDAEWVIMIERATITELYDMAKSLSEKIQLKSSVNQVVYKNYEQFVTRCDAMGLDHTEHTENEIDIMWELFSD